MGFLDKLWDETLAGPAPEKGLGKLRKYKSLSAVRSPDHPIVANRYHDDQDNQTVPAVTRSITILRTKNNLCVDPGSPASSPTTPSGPSSPFSRLKRDCYKTNYEMHGGLITYCTAAKKGKDPDSNGSIRKKTTFDSSHHSDTVYDWILISALDR